MKTYFVSDTHLGSLAFDDRKEKEKKLVRWLESIKSDCEALYLLGDIIDFWYEYKNVVPRGYVRFFGKIAEFTDAGIPVYWFTGNHDIWMYSYVQNELGVEVITQPITKEIYGYNVYMAHGDGLGDPDIKFAIIRKIFHNRLCQILFSTIHPRLAMTYGLNWAKRSRLKRGTGPEKYLGEDKEHLIIYAKNHAAKESENVPDFYIFGHRHILIDLGISKKSRVIILGDWIYHFSYGVLDKQGFMLNTFEDNDII
jgi:UDP-2,3-diacylglucosamine hydrolase